MPATRPTTTPWWRFGYLDGTDVIDWGFFFGGGGAAFQLTAINVHSQTFKASKHIDTREQSIKICASEIERLKDKVLDITLVPMLHQHISTEAQKRQTEYWL